MTICHRHVSKTNSCWERETQSMGSFVGIAGIIHSLCSSKYSIPVLGLVFRRRFDRFSVLHIDWYYCHPLVYEQSICESKTPISSCWSVRFEISKISMMRCSNRSITMISTIRADEWIWWWLFSVLILSKTLIKIVHQFSAWSYRKHIQLVLVSILSS